MGCAAARIISRTARSSDQDIRLNVNYRKREISSTGFGVASPVLELMQRGDTQAFWAGGLGCRRVAWVLGQAKRHQIQCSISHVSCDKRVSYKGANLKLRSSPMFLVGLFKNSKKVPQKWPKTGSKSITPLGTYSIIPRSVLKTENQTSK